MFQSQYFVASDQDEESFGPALQLDFAGKKGWWSDHCLDNRHSQDETKFMAEAASSDRQAQADFNTRLQKRRFLDL